MKNSSNDQGPTAKETSFAKTHHPLINFLILIGFLILVAGLFAYVRFIAIPQANEKINTSALIDNSSERY